MPDMMKDSETVAALPNVCLSELSKPTAKWSKRRINWCLIRNSLWNLDTQNCAALASTIDKLMDKDLVYLRKDVLEDVLLRAIQNGQVV